MWTWQSAPEDRIIFNNFVLYDLENDIGETRDVSELYPEIVVKLSVQLDWAEKDIGDLGKRGMNARPLGDEPSPLPTNFFL
jgi:arylsulfatase